MVVKKVSENISVCFGVKRGKKMAYIATNDGMVGSGYAYGETAEEASENLAKENQITSAMTK